jgi:hypothetical protein
LTRDLAGLRHVGGHPHPATVVTAADRLDHDGAVDSSRELVDPFQVVGAFDGRVARHRSAQGLQPPAHHQLVLRMYQRLRRRRHVDALGDQLFQQLNGHVLVVEGQRVHAGSDAAQIVEIGVRSDHHVRTHLGGRVGGVGGKDPQTLTQRDRGLVGHPGELAAADHGDLRQCVGNSRHGNYGVTAAERGIYRR